MADFQVAGPATGAEIEHVLGMRIRDLENQVDELQNLYVTSTQLMSAVRPDDVIAVLKEILLNLIGADAFDVSIREQGDTFTTLLSGELPSPTNEKAVNEWQQMRAYALQLGEPLFLGLPDLVAVIPLMAGGDAIGVLSIFHLLPQKSDGISARDIQVLGLLATHSALALVCAALYQRHSTALHEVLKSFRTPT